MDNCPAFKLDETMVPSKGAFNSRSSRSGLGSIKLCLGIGQTFLGQFGVIRIWAVFYQFPILQCIFIIGFGNYQVHLPTFEHPLQEGRPVNICNWLPPVPLFFGRRQNSAGRKPGFFVSSLSFQLFQTISALLKSLSASSNLPATGRYTIDPRVYSSCNSGFRRLYPVLFLPVPV